MPPHGHTTQPAPSTLHASTHAHHRLFLGPLPTSNSEKVNTARRKRYGRLLSERRDPNRRSEESDAGLVDLSESGRTARFPFLRRPRSHRESMSEDGQHTSTQTFFVIGQEFRASPAVDDHATHHTPPVVLINPDILGSDPWAAPATPPPELAERPKPTPVSRPSIYPRSTTDRASFRTARSRPSDSPLQTGNLSRPGLRAVGTTGTSQTGTTDFFSAKSTVSAFDQGPEEDDPAEVLVRDVEQGVDEQGQDQASTKASLNTNAQLLSTSPTMLDDSASPRLRTKLRSALRKGSQKFKTPPSDDPPALDVVGQPSLPTTLDPNPPIKKRTVQFPAETPLVRAESPPNVDAGPAPPTEVLARTGSAVQGTSAGVVEAVRKEKQRRAKQAPRDDPFEDGAVGEEAGEDGKEEQEVCLRDRMLVAVGKNSHPHLTGYDETEARRKPSERVKEIEEYLVVYRKGWVELYKEWSTPLGRTFRKSKRLCFAIPLFPKVATFSVFSRRDLSFALCLDTVTMREEIQKVEQAVADGSSPHDARESMRRRVLERMKQTKEFQWVQERSQAGNNRSLVFIFIGRERTRMLDWCWQVWKDLGGQIPEQLRIQVPVFDSMIDLPRPREDIPGSRATLRAFSRSRILLDVFTALRAQLPDYDDLVARERERSGGSQPLRLELAWEADMHLDWVPPFAEWSVEDRKREWAVLAGLTMSQPNDPCELLLLPIRHDANELKLADGMRLSEPPAIEGFLHRLSGTKGTPTRRRVYVHSQSGYLLSSSTRHTQAPLPPYLHKIDDPLISEAYFSDERIRNTHNMLYSDGLIDFRNIVRMEPPKDSNETPFERQAQREEDPPETSDALQKTLAHSTSKHLIIMLDSKEVVWLEASDERVALEWFIRLRELCKYWSHRQRVDARDRMNLIKEVNTTIHIHTAGTADSELARDSLTCRIANWCPYERCSTILHCGRLYLKPSSSAQFREAFCILVPGYLIECSVTADCYHKRKYRYSLAETYIFSGYLAQTQLHERLRIDEAMETRLYQDGLSSSDGVEDCSFVIWIRREERVDTQMDSVLESAESSTLTTNSRKSTVPRLAKRPTKMIVCRARCKLERDLWVRALSIEIESNSREHASQQKRLRYGGTVAA